MTSYFCFHVQVLSLSGIVLETVFKHLEHQEILLCSNHLSSSHAVHLIQTTGETSRSVTLSFSHSLYLLCDRAHVVLWAQMQVSSASSAASRRSSSNTSLRAPLVWHSRSTVIIEKKCRSEWLTATFCCSSLGGFSANLWEVTTVSQELRDMNSSSSSRTRSAEDVEEPLNGVPNPTACLHVGDIILFTLSTHHYPEYDLWVYLGIHLYPC